MALAPLAAISLTSLRRPRSIFALLRSFSPSDLTVTFGPPHTDRPPGGPVGFAPHELPIIIADMGLTSYGADRLWGRWATGPLTRSRQQQNRARGLARLDVAMRLCRVGER